VISRRSLLHAISLSSVAVSSWGGRFSVAHGQQPDRFPNPLNIPELLEGSQRDGAVEFRLRLQDQSTEFFPGVTTPTWGINGSYLGPTLRLRNNDAVSILVENSLPEHSTLHWHGLHVPAICDGGPHQVVAPGRVWNPQFTVRQQASTYWYHSHVLDRTGPQVYQGLAGMLIVDDEASSGLDIPSDYGVDDIPIIIQDKNFNTDGTFRYIDQYDDLITGVQGDTILVNGTTWPHLTVRTERVRLRLLNAANGRTFFLAFTDGRSFQMIASDGGFLGSPIEMRNLSLAPGERAEIIVDCSDRQPVNLISQARISDYPEYQGAMSSILRRMNTQGFEILALRPDTDLAPSPLIPSALVSAANLDPDQAVRTRRFLLSMGFGMRSGDNRGPGSGQRNGLGGGYGGGNYSINGRRMVMDYINETVPLGDVEIWELANNSPMTHPFHVHNVQFQILDRNGSPPPPEERGLKDTVKVASGETVRILLQFQFYSDPENPYMYHCHILEHEDRGMMGQFLVV